ncbi:insulin-like growth factor-binding protein 1 [Ursus americanus]|uniref:insulin-like growth factor-binding protein 1 n=1 Tax=Ursus americanus TaxID=9643 RepID=UPI001E67956A|nr:insulin-like growth factor-binding protein 1 [Ursus americanus]
MMPEVPAACAWPLLLLLALQLGAAAGAPQPWHCAPCSPEKLALCPPVPDSCAEPAPPASCGCCPMCALPEGSACGVATARCATGLSCRALPEEPRPLHALIRGQGVCRPSDPAADAKESSESSEITQEQLLENFHLMAPSEEDVPVPWNAVSSYRIMRAGYASDTDSDKLKEPCRRELHRILAQLAEEHQSPRHLNNFYLPNCNKNGFYHSRQCRTATDGQRGVCWCVYPWSGERIPGSVEVRGDPNCNQYFAMHS